MISNKNGGATKNPKALLEKELAALKILLPYEAAQNLVVCWKPDADSPVSGEVKGKIVFLYDVDINEAIGTLRHEYLDFYLSKRLISPVMALVNFFIEQKTSEIYREKEKVVDSLLTFIDLAQDANK